MDRLPTVTIDTKMTEVIAITEGKELILNAFARQTLWKAALNVIANLKGLNYELGNGIPLSQAYQQKIGLLSKLVEVSQLQSSPKTC